VGKVLLKCFVAPYIQAVRLTERKLFQDKNRIFLWGSVFKTITVFARRMHFIAITLPFFLVLKYLFSPVLISKQRGRVAVRGKGK